MLFSYLFDVYYFRILCVCVYLRSRKTTRIKNEHGKECIKANKEINANCDNVFV